MVTMTSLAALTLMNCPVGWSVKDTPVAMDVPLLLLVN
jgi:hypothetical protein